MTLEEAVEAYVARLTDEVRMEDAIDQILTMCQTRSRHPEEQIEQLLDQDPRLFIDVEGLDDDEDEPLNGDDDEAEVDEAELAAALAAVETDDDDGPAEVFLVPRARVFDGARFRVVPTPFEVEQGVLIPGHRFMPFCETVATSAQVQLTGPGLTGARRQVIVPLELAATLCRFAGPSWAAAAELERALASETTARPAHEPQRELVLLSFDFRAFYQQHQFRAGDSLIFVVEDWHVGAFSVEYESAARYAEQFAEVQHWCEALADGLDLVLDDLGGEAPLAEQLAYAYHLSEPIVLEFPGMDLTTYLSNHAEFQLHERGLNTCLWYKDEELPEEENELPHVPTGAMDSLDAILADVGLVGGAVVLEALMRDEVASGGGTPEGALKRLIGAVPLRFYDNQQQDAYQRLAGRLWRELRDGRQPQGTPDEAALRGRLLRLWLLLDPVLRRLDADPTQAASADPSDLRLAVQVIGLLTVLLDQLNQCADAEDEESLPSLALPLPDAAVEELARRLSDALPPTARGATPTS